jgi:hypothetical protein
VVGAEDMPLEPRYFLILAIGTEIQIFETEDDSALSGFKTIGDGGQSPVEDGYGVSEITLL